MECIYLHLDTGFVAGKALPPDSPRLPSTPAPPSQGSRLQSPVPFGNQSLADPPQHGTHPLPISPTNLVQESRTTKCKLVFDRNHVGSSPKRPTPSKCRQWAWPSDRISAFLRSIHELALHLAQPDALTLGRDTLRFADERLGILRQTCNR